MANYQNILRQAHQAIADVADNADSWRAFLRSAAYTTHYAFPNQALIYSQRPGATMLADIDTWNRAAGRWVNRGAHGVASLGTGNMAGNVRYLFDIKDTHPAGKASKPLGWQITDANRYPTLQALQEKHSAESLPEIFGLQAALFVAQYGKQLDADLQNAVIGSTLEWAKPQEQTAIFANLITQSAVYMAAVRCGLGDSAVPQDAFADIDRFDTESAVLALGNAVNRAGRQMTGLYLGETYTLTETRPADGYALADEITFRLLQKVDEDGNNLQEAEVYHLTTKNFLFWTWDDWKLLDDATVIMRDDTIKVEISKKDLTTMEELPGAELTLTDKDGKEIDRWVSTDKPHYIEKLPAGDYTLTEVKAPDGYAFAESATFTVLPTGEVQQFEMLDDVIKVEISKKDLTTMEELPGAELTLTNKDGKEIDRWVSSDTPHYIEKLPAGDYTLTEVKAPDGYAFAESVPFTVLPTGEVQQFEMLDDVIKVEISKVDITTNKELPGAELIITNKDGKVVEHWTSTDKPHYIEKLPAGDYTLTEITAPNGYEIAEDISFTVLPNGDVQRVVMKDAPIPEQPVQPTPPSTPTPTPLIPQTGDTFPLGLLLALAGLSLAGLAALIYKCVHCKSVAEHDETEDGER
ncbi:MAG: SpaA isopeptide-forming pilin-related protein [Gemmiger sp.]|uniref:MSCRAMM family protein n=1 Tax=Gemmiger sp. TaxID=2049027 RepID=UPI002A90FB5F|nr:SpaA isopeptide-forming pilin-related protein [Gemmiger sp.]MDY5411007.1 SpaA isopeptide-forming pilin-related protein [Gemmiger sp.]